MHLRMAVVSLLQLTRGTFQRLRYLASWLRTCTARLNDRWLTWYLAHHFLSCLASMKLLYTAHATRVRTRRCTQTAHRVAGTIEQRQMIAL